MALPLMAMPTACRDRVLDGRLNGDELLYVMGGRIDGARLCLVLAGTLMTIMAGIGASEPWH